MSEGSHGSKRYTLGNSTGVSALSLVSGTGAMQLNAGGVCDLDSAGVLSLNSSAAAINIGNDDIDQALNLGTDGVRTVTVGSTNGAAALALRSGTGACSLTAGAACDIDAVGALSLNSSGAVMNIGDDDDDFDINIGTSGARAITIGNGNSEVIIDSLLSTNAGIEQTLAADPGAGATPRTSNNLAGTVTFTGLTTAIDASDNVVINNTSVDANSIVFANISVYAGTGDPIIKKIVCGAGTITLSIVNHGAAILNANVSIQFLVLNPV